MAIIKPYYRIVRVTKRPYPTDFIYNEKYANDRYILNHSYKIIENDLKKILEFIEPSDSNTNTYSHRLYELLLRCATEFETNCKQILAANGYTKKKLDITDYFKINQATHLSDYEVKLCTWYPAPKVLKPFAEWKKDHSLSWYEDYNDVKHNRSQNFCKAKLSTVLNAAAALISILFAQFESEAFTSYGNSYGYSTDNEGFYYQTNSLFSVKPFIGWIQEEQYEINPDMAIVGSEPFQKFNFI
jgi:hypothetical protein